MAEATLSVRLQSPERIFTNGDIVKGSVKLSAYANLTLKSVQVLCRCTVVAFATIGDHTRLIEHQHLFQKSLTVFPGKDLPRDMLSDKLMLAPGVYSFPFELELPGPEANLPESFDKSDDISGIFWHVRGRVTRYSKLQKPIIAQSNFAFVPQPTGALAFPRGNLEREQTFALSICCDNRLGLQGIFAKKRHVPVRLHCRLSMPAAGIHLDEMKSPIGLHLSCDMIDVVHLERISIRVQEELKVYCAISHITSVKPPVTYPLLVCNPHSLLGQEESNFSFHLSALGDKNIPAGTINLPHFRHNFKLVVSMVFSPAADLKRKQVVNFVAELPVQPRLIKSIPQVGQVPTVLAS